MKYLGIDYGTKRIGVAVSDDTGTIAFPLTTITAGRESLQQIDLLIKEKGAEHIVLGESRNYKGDRNDVMEDIEQFKSDLQELAGVPVTYESELLSSSMAARQYAPDGSRKANPSQDKLDASAAAIILQSYLDRKK
jgi:putative Holliday junction resolvase